MSEIAPLIRRTVGVAFLLIQVVAVGHARSVPSKWLGSWAPNDYAAWYRIQVRAEGNFLSPDQVERRYRLPPEETGYFFNYPVENIMDIVRQYEQTYGRDEQAEAVLLYRRNGIGPIQEWRWPHN